MLRSLARLIAYVIAFLLAAVWLSGGIASFDQPLLDLGRARIGDAILAFARNFSLSPAGTLRLASMLAGLKLLIGFYFLLAIVVAGYERMRRRGAGDEILELGLFMSALATIVAVSPVIDNQLALGIAIGELLLCVLASGLIGFARSPVREPRPSLVLRLAGWVAARIVNAWSRARPAVAMAQQAS
jgi:hypothetical protein